MLVKKLKTFADR